MHAEVRALDAWSLFEETELFLGMTAAQRTDLEALLRPRRFLAGEVLVDAGHPAPEVLLIAEGSVEPQRGEGSSGRGAIVPAVSAVLEGGAVERRSAPTIDDIEELI